MRRAGLAPATIDARHADDETHTVAAAGTRGRVTLVTDMAGRGTDIVLEPAAVAAGGLALVATFVHASRRLERQLQGRVARRGEPGSAEAWLLAGDPVPGATDPAIRSPFVGRLLTGIPAGVVAVTLRAVQRREASRARRLRMRLLEAARARAYRDLIGRTED
jgi:preprotein translocase subunit SecA